jgi:hypothetical protein
MVHIDYHITIAKYNFFKKMINLIHVISISNYVFEDLIVFYATRWTKQYLIYMCFKKKLNQLNLIYIWICLYLQ